MEVKNPNDGYNLFKHAHRAVKYMPIDKSTSDMLSPIFDFTSANQNMQSLYNTQNYQMNMAPQTKRMLNSGITTNKRSVSETKKKY